MVRKERIKQAKNYPILDLAERLRIEIGKNNTCRCINPMHDDKNPSMSFDSRTNSFKCFSCGYKGDTIELVMEVNKFSFKEAIDWILGSEACQGPRIAPKALIQALKEGREELGGNDIKCYKKNNKGTRWI